jgi:hypothetical protein
VFRNLNSESNPTRLAVITGFFDADLGNSRAMYRFSCSLNSADGGVRRVDISQRQGAATADRYRDGDDAILACQRKAEQRIRRAGYGHVQYGWLNADSRRNGRIAGTATAQRGGSERDYEFAIRCRVNLDNGNVRSMQVVLR